MAATVPTELPVFTRYYDLFVWSFQRSEGFPRVLRPTLTQRFGELLLAALELLLELRYTRERTALFARLNITLEKLRVVSRALKDRRALSIPQYEFFNRELNAVGRMLGGWMKANARKRLERPA
jgi:hypothetical protein